jgi:type I restriction enzyme S subunit
MSPASETLDEMCELIIDCPHFTPEWTTSGYLVIRNQNVRDGRLDLSERSYTHLEDFERRIRRAKPRAGDIIFTREAPMGEVCLVPDGLECCVGQRQVLLRPAHNVDHRYLFYALRSPAVRHQILWNEGTGSTVSNVRIPILKAIKIPRLGEAEASIGEVLDNIDQKIEFNRRVNETLEAMAQAIFRDWFVDFGPVRRKLAGETDPVAIMGGLMPDPARAAELAGLFPGGFGEDGLPAGWSGGVASDLIEFNPNEPLKRGVLAPYSDMSSLPTSGSCADAPVTREFRSGMRFRNGDALLARITPCLENGKSAFVDMLPEGAVGWGSTEFIVLRGRLGTPSPLGYLLCRDPEFRAHAIQSMTGTSGRQRAQADSLTGWPMVIPPPTILSAFGDYVVPLFAKISANSAENRTLAETRDYLLPSLMSGAVRVGDVTQQEAAA